MPGQVIQALFPHGIPQRWQSALHAAGNCCPPPPDQGRPGLQRATPRLTPVQPRVASVGPSSARTVAPPRVAEVRQPASAHSCSHPSCNTPVRGSHPVQRQSNGSTFPLPPNLANFQRGPGQSLPSQVLQKMEAFFDKSFSDVRIHVGPQAAAIGALAFTHGTNIYFAPGQYNPHTPHGQRLLGHELAHVVQQRSGRVRNPLGAGIAVVQDRAMEAEADRLGLGASLYQMPVQAKLPVNVAQRKSPLTTSSPHRTGKHSYRITAGTGGQHAGSVMVHAKGTSTIELSDLGVESARRREGVGGALIASALQTGLRLGKTSVSLASQDNGSGHLTQWYKEMGFTQVGVNRHGCPQLQAPIARVLSAVQRKSGIAGLPAVRLPESPANVSLPAPPNGNAMLSPATRPLAVVQPQLSRLAPVPTGPLGGGPTIQLMKRKLDDLLDGEEDEDEEEDEEEDEDEDEVSEYEFEEVEDEEERLYWKRQESNAKKMKRASKPKGFGKRVFKKAKLRRASVKIDDHTIHQLLLQLAKKKKKTTKVKRPKKNQTAVYEAECTTCGKLIYLNSRKQEMGVALGRKYKRTAPHHGHKIDLSWYYSYLEGKLSTKRADLKQALKLSDREVDALLKCIRQKAHWNIGNIDLEHLLCNEWQSRGQRGFLSDTQEQRGKRYVNTHWITWLQECLDELQGTKHQVSTTKKMPSLTSNPLVSIGTAY